MTRSRTFYHRALLAIFVMSAFLCLWRLDQTAFWDDEAHISIVARNFVHSGTLSGWDGRNLIGYRNGSFLDGHFRTRNAPLDCLFVAASFALLGPSTFAARLPFALFGLVSLLAFGYLLRREFRVRDVVLYALAYFALGVVFLLNARTCRYNALALGFPIWAYAGYRYYLGTKRIWALYGCALALVGLFYASYLFALAFGCALGFVALFCHREQFARRDVPAILSAGALFLAATIPYMVHYRAWDYPRVFHDKFLRHVATLLAWNVRDLGGIAPNIWTLAVVAVFIFRLKRVKAHGMPPVSPNVDLEAQVVRPACEWAALCAVYIFVLCVVSPQPATVTYIADTRYLLPIAPFVAGLAGLALWQMHRLAPALGVIALAVALCFNIPFPNAYLPQASPFWRYSPVLLPAYLSENARPYPTSTDAVLAYLRAHPIPNEQIAVSPSHMNLALIFYAGEQLQVCCQLGERTLLPPEAASQLDDKQFFARSFPDRIIAFGKRDGSDNQLAFDRLMENFERERVVNGRTTRYRYQLEATLPIFWDETQRPELFLHSFGPVRQFAKDDAVFIYRRTNVME